jgi:hypothetical protein
MSGGILTAEGEWVRFQVDLVPCLRALEEDEYLIVRYKEANYFVQFFAQGQFGMRAEAVSNSFIEPLEACLTIEDYDRMSTLGWKRATNKAPTVLEEREPPDGSSNFFQDLPLPVDIEALAALTIRTLREVYGVRHPGELVYKAFSLDGDSLRFPTLRLKRAKE